MMQGQGSEHGHSVASPDPHKQALDKEKGFKLNPDLSRHPITLFNLQPENSNGALLCNQSWEISPDTFRRLHYYVTDEMNVKAI